MKFDSLSRIVLVAAVASGFALTAKAEGKQVPAQPQGPSATTRTLDGQRPPPPKPDPKDKKHKRKTPPKPAPPPPPKPPPKTPPGG